MPSFDVVSEVNAHEVTNAIDQARREVDNRFDFKGSDAKFEHAEDKVTLIAQSVFQLQQMMVILETKLSKRGVDIKCMECAEPQESLHEARQVVTIKQGISQELAKKIVKAIKDSKLKVQATIQGDQVRVTGKKRDDLQDVIALLKDGDFNLPLQFVNFRD